MSYNDITGDKIATKTVTDQYRNNWDQIFNKKPDQFSNGCSFDNALCAACEGTHILEDESGIWSCYCVKENFK